MMSTNMGSSVCVIGKIVSNSTSGNSIKVQLADGKQVDVTMDGDHNDPMDDGYIQMVATIRGSNSLECEAYVCLPGDIDLDIYNQAITVASQYNNLFSATAVDGAMM